DKLFFFFDVEWERDYGAAYAYDGLTVPDASWQAGNFSNILGKAAVGTDILGRSIYSNELFNYYTQRALPAGQLDPVTGLMAASSGTVRDPFSAAPASIANPTPVPTNIIPLGASTVCAPNPACAS